MRRLQRHEKPDKRKPSKLYTFWSRFKDRLKSSPLPKPSKLLPTLALAFFLSFPTLGKARGQTSMRAPTTPQEVFVEIEREAKGLDAYSLYMIEKWLNGFFKKWKEELRGKTPEEKKRINERYKAELREALTYIMWGIETGNLEEVLSTLSIIYGGIYPIGNLQ